MKTCPNCTRYDYNMVELELMLRTQIQCKGGYKGEQFEYCPWCGHKLIYKDTTKKDTK